MSSATAEARPEHRNLVGAFWRGFREFRRSRPFWGGLLAMIAGVPILYFPYAHLSLGGVTIAMSTTAGAGSLIIGVLLIILGLTAWFQPAVRIFAGVATTLLTLVSIPVSNLAGFGMALLPGIIGGGLMMAWAKLPEPAVAAAPTAEEPAAGAAPEAAPETATEAAPEAAAGQPATEQPATERPAAGASVPAQQAAEPKEVR
ncbi:DUF6114 domain-containing protein [Kitasatospora purpeofusca]|uniref:DUF6114 domain-containing protein n=1 Tax=Kitasatospora purpeofusca TaxID=67352 RepID=UPI002A5A1D01|nr:DUF6114 domain-containing protein [Kitasatospora purpeofusca]MDY0810454.1 DUF6114 domain-containing protein [Kitasatospora purpeofusca]